MRNPKIVAALVVVSIVALGGPALAGQAQGKALSASLELAKASFGAADELAMTFTLTNTTDQAIAVVRWQTPISGIEGDLFQVTRDGQPVLYTGRLYKWAAPVAADYLEIPAGESVSAVVDISAAYDMADRGQYEVRYRTELNDLLVGAEKQLASQLVESDSVTLWFDGVERDLAFEDFLEQSAEKAGSTSFVGCTSSRQTTLNTAKANAKGYSDRSYSDLYYRSYTNPPTKYAWWFGTATSSRYSTVKTHFNNLAWAFANAAFVFDCSTCTMNAYAYVYPTQPYRVYLCSAFWSAPATGRDSKAGTLVHEVSHFSVIAGTQDYVYGATGAHNLAVSNPSRAVNNADNHEYFAEDHP